MANLGNAWHIPANAEPRGRGGMRDPVGAIVPGTAVTIISGNQFAGPGGNPGNQLQTGSAVFFKKATDAAWTLLPMLWLRTLGNNKYYSATIPAGTFNTGDVCQYYLRIPYDDHDTTFLRASGNGSATTDSEAAAQSAPFSFTVEDSAVRGHWGPVFPLPNVAVHAHLLPNGRVLIWGRRDRPEDTLDEHECTPFIWNPQNGQITNTPQPKLANGTTVNLFCAGHAFLADGRLLTMGGHNADSDGISQAAIYDWRNNTWTPTAPMTAPNGDQVRRWYPTATILPNGEVLVLSGSYIDPTRPPGLRTVVVDLLQVWSNGTWRTIRKADGMPLNFIGLPLYPRMHVASDGRVFMSGPLARTLLLKTATPGGWTEVAFRALGICDYCPSVMYDLDKFLFVGGGGPTAEAEIIDLGGDRKWHKTKPMKFARRQHNATVLPDGTVLVVGGSRGAGFNNLNAGQPVHTAELWDPATENWTELAAESVDRCYHSTSVLLPDATVLSAGGGEYRPDDVNPNAPEDSHRNAQVLSPPYLFKGPRPVISSVPASVDYGDTFDVSTPQANQIRKVSLIRPASVTHAFDESQRINFLQFQAGSGKLTVTAPDSPNVCPPGHYMLFLVSQAGVPSLASMVQILPPAAPAAIAAIAEEEPALRHRELVALSPRMAEPGAYLQIYAREAEVSRAAKGTQVIVGITGTCPYGIGACWGGAYEALQRLQGVGLVSPVPNTDDSTAEVFLERESLPPLDVWEQQFQAIVNGTYELRGVEVTVRGVVRRENGDLLLVERGDRPSVRLKTLQSGEKIQWDHKNRERKPLEPGEDAAYNDLMTATAPPDGQEVNVTGPLMQTDAGYELHVRAFTRH